MKLALTELDSAIKSNILAIVKKFNFFELILCRQWKGIQLSKKKIFSRYYQHLIII